MKIAQVRIDPSVLEKHDPEWRFALMAAPQSLGQIVTIIAEDGTMGYGYGSAMPHYGATQDAVKATLERFVPLLVGKDFSTNSIIMFSTTIRRRRRSTWRCMICRRAGSAYPSANCSGGRA
jgi:hypothetical protein